jgi:hypothetical protein
MMAELMRQLFTGKNNTTLDLGRVLWATVTVHYLGLSAWHVVTTHSFDPMGWATGAAAVLAGGGAALGMKAGTEPGAN